MSKTRTRSHWYALLALVPILSVLALWSSLKNASDEPDPPSHVARPSYPLPPASLQLAGGPEVVEAIENPPPTTGDGLRIHPGDSQSEPITLAATTCRDAGAEFAFVTVGDRVVQMQVVHGAVTARMQQLGTDDVGEIEPRYQAYSHTDAGRYRVESNKDEGSILVTLVAIRVGQSQESGSEGAHTLNSGQGTRWTGTDCQEGELRSLQISVTTYRDVMSGSGEFRVAGPLVERRPAPPRFDETPNGTQLKGFIEPAPRVQRAGKKASALQGVPGSQGDLVIK
jgi:hypothetical protein